LTCLGSAFLLLTFMYEHDFAVPAAIILSLGIGYFISTLLSYKLSARFDASNDLPPVLRQTNS
jgi:hypothetical protein